MRLFGTDGIRGSVGQHPLVPDFVLRLGLATAAVLARSAPRPSVVVGRDTRHSGQMLQNALVAGLLAGGTTVVDAGIITTPGVAYLVRKLGTEMGAVISASHNPVDENGIKLFDAHGFKLPVAVEEEIEALASGGQQLPFSRPFGRCIESNGMRELYLEDLTGEHRDLRLDPLTLVVDCANGAASWLAPECFGRLGARIIPVHASPTGLNINDRAGSEHIRRHPQGLGQLVQQFSADLGLAFDGDADRVVFVDERGGLVDGDHLLGILADYLHKRQRLAAQTIVATSMRNTGLLNYTRAAGLGLAEVKVGDKYVVEKLVDLAQRDPRPAAVALGGEQAGHVVLLDQQHNTGDGIRTALYVLRAYLDCGATSLAELAGCVRKLPQVIASAAVSSKPPLANMKDLQALEREMRESLPGLLRMELRYSGTEPLIRLMMEADERHSEGELAARARAICRTVQEASGTVDGGIEILNCTQGGVL